LSLNSELQLAGRLAGGPAGLVLHVDGGIWQIEAPRAAHKLVGKDVELIGTRDGFNTLICKQVWPAGTKRPRHLGLNIETTILSAVAIYGFLAAIIGIAAYVF
jgi:hypothetical protein